jgi:hypothetical protein
MANSRIIKHPEEALEIDVECILEKQRVVIGGTFCDFSGGRGVGKLVAKVRRFARKEVAVYSK